MVKLGCGLRTVLWMTLVMGLSWFPVAWADLNDGLVAHYPFNGNAQDATGNGNDGIQHGGIEFTEGLLGNAAKFDGIDDYINVTDNDSLDNTSYLAISLWINFHSFKATGTYTKTHVPIINKHYSDEVKGRNSYGLFLNSETRKISFSAFDSQNLSGAASAPPELELNLWYHLVVIFNNGQVKIFLNGNLITSQETDITHIGNSPEPLKIGDWFYQHSASHYSIRYSTFKGLMDDVRIYNRALSECEIKSLYTGKDECKPNLVTLNDFTATPFQDDIRVHWETASEVDNAGFHLWRAIGEGWKTGDYSQVIRITDQLISSKGAKVGGYPYSYVDSNVESGITYYYGLEDIDFNGQSTVHFDFIDEATAK